MAKIETPIAPFYGSLVVYAVSVGMGFAALEEIDYVFFNAGPLWGSVAVARAVLQVPGHYIMAVMMVLQNTNSKKGGNVYDNYH